ncbi:hypothetical protein N7481_011072 [Penicillium waksmanii]|uniref:uncharacterized protein n=1 Tax=Penicillium waksmanii TaxID=69791 RepID=UPI002547C332|nr:uncharacterized protein N7481_011072 [Penicillium waksmanii]KAJ5973862.1 hypothetical protein N7481_011072 [Penicillium waksmanii]
MPPPSQLLRSCSCSWWERCVSRCGTSLGRGPPPAPQARDGDGFRLGPMADGARPPNTTNSAPADPLLGPDEAPVAPPPIHYWWHVWDFLDVAKLASVSQVFRNVAHWIDQMF